TGKKSIDDRAEGLDAGADDYLVKPFAAKELSARIRALLRRPTSVLPTVLTAGPYTLNPSTLTVVRTGEECRLKPTEFALLEFLARHPQETFKGEALMDRLWSAESEATTATLRTAIKKIRQKLGDENIIEYVAGVGYRLGASGRKD